MNPITFETRQDAETVLETMNKIVKSYDVVLLSDLYQLIGLEPTHKESLVGWVGEIKAEISEVGDGYSLKFPDPEPIT